MSTETVATASAKLCRSLNVVAGIGIGKDWDDYYAAREALEACGATFDINLDTVASMISYVYEAIDDIQAADEQLWQEGFALPGELATLSARWQDMAARVKDAQERAVRIRIDDWQGTGADAYRSILPAYEEQSTKLTDLADHMASVTNETLERVNTTNDMYLLNLITLQSELLAAGNTKTQTQWPTRNFFQRIIGSKGGAADFTCEFFKRTGEMAGILKKALLSLSEFAERSQPGHGFYQTTIDIIAENGVTAHVGDFEPVDGVVDEELLDTDVEPSILYKEGEEGP